MIRKGKLHFVQKPDMNSVSLSWLPWPQLLISNHNDSFWFNYVSSSKDGLTTYKRILTFIDQGKKRSIFGLTV